jgi:hypothetical protein
MPLPSDEKLIALSQDLLNQFDTLFGLHPGFRPAHAKGIMLTGTFTPSPDAASLTRAPHITRDSTPVTVRFSNSTGLPLLPDNDPNANPRGLAIRFSLAEHVHTDIVSTQPTVSLLERARNFSSSYGPPRPAIHRSRRPRPLRHSSVPTQGRWHSCRRLSQLHPALPKNRTSESQPTVLPARRASAGMGVTVLHRTRA